MPPLAPYSPATFAPLCRDILKPPIRRRFAAPLAAAFPPCRAALPSTGG